MHQYIFHALWFEFNKKNPYNNFISLPYEAIKPQ